MLKQDYPWEKVELLLVDGMSTDNTRKLVKPFVEKYPNIHILDNLQHTAPYAMNIGIRMAKGEYICRIDAHAFYPVNYISTLLHYFTALPNATNVGPSCITRPSDNNVKSIAIATICSHPFGVGDSKFRTTLVNSPIEVDTVPFGFWRRSWFEKVGMFDEELTRNQDDEFNARTIKYGGKIYLLPKLTVNYFARNTILKTAQMFYQYGIFKPLVNYKIGKTTTKRQIIPFLFFWGIIVGAVISAIVPYVWIIYSIVMAIYLAICMYIGIRYALLKHMPQLLFYIPLCFITIHLSYGWGYTIGLYNLIFKRPFNVKANR